MTFSGVSGQRSQAAAGWWFSATRITIYLIVAAALPLTASADNIRMFDSSSNPDELAKFLLDSRPDKRGLVINHDNVAGFKILFEFDSAEINNKALNTIDVIGRALNNPRLKKSRFVIEGHTDAIGPANYNLNLSERRARSVREYLVLAYGINADLLMTEGKGETEPMDNISHTNSLNRRVQLRILP